MNEKKRWAVADCGLYPSEKQCKMKLMAPEDQFEEVLTIALEHVIQSHGAIDSPELREEIRKSIDIREM